MNPTNTAYCTLIGLVMLSGDLTAGETSRVDVDDQSAAVVVSYADLNLSSPEGVNRLYRRIQVAAHQVCGYTDIRDLSLYARHQECYRKAVQDAVDQVHSSALTELHRSRFKDVS